MTDKANIKKDIKDNAETLNKLKVKRNAGELTPEVIQMCGDHLDMMVKTLVDLKEKEKFPQERLDSALAAVEELKKDPEWLAKVSQFADIFEEVIVWNQMIRDKIITVESTVAHREYDLALLDSICCKKYTKTIRDSICFLLFNYACCNRDRKNGK